MPEYVAPKRDMEFVLFDLLDAQSTWQRIPALADVSRDLVTAVLEEAGKIASEQLAPLNQPRRPHRVFMESRGSYDATGIQRRVLRTGRRVAGSALRATRSTAGKVCRRC